MEAVFVEGLLGMALSKDIVASVAPGGQASAHGVRVGDRVTLVGSTAASDNALELIKAASRPLTLVFDRAAAAGQPPVHSPAVVNPHRGFVPLPFKLASWSAKMVGKTVATVAGAAITTVGVLIPGVSASFRVPHLGSRISEPAAASTVLLPLAATVVVSAAVYNSLTGEVTSAIKKLAHRVAPDLQLTAELLNFEHASTLRMSPQWGVYAASADRADGAGGRRRRGSLRP